MKILLVEDDEGISQIIAYILEENGHTLHKITEEKEIERMLLREKIDLLLMDVSLGGQNGGTITKKIKSVGGKLSVPIILMSAHPDLDKLSKKVGADAYLVKPFDISDLLRVVHRFDV